MLDGYTDAIGVDMTNIVSRVVIQASARLDSSLPIFSTG